MIGAVVMYVESRRHWKELGRLAKDEIFVGGLLLRVLADHRSGGLGVEGRATIDHEMGCKMRSGFSLEFMHWHGIRNLVFTIEFGL